MLNPMNEGGLLTPPIFWDVQRVTASGEAVALGRLCLDTDHVLWIVSAGGDATDHPLQPVVNTINRQDDLDEKIIDPDRPHTSLALMTPRGHAEFPRLVEQHLAAAMLRLTRLDAELIETEVLDG